MAKRKKNKLDLASLVGGGENPRGYTSQNVNGTGHSGNSHPGWNKDTPYTAPEMPEQPGTPWGNANRTSE